MILIHFDQGSTNGENGVKVQYQLQHMYSSKYHTKCKRQLLLGFPANNKYLYDIPSILYTCSGKTFFAKILISYCYITELLWNFFQNIFIQFSQYSIDMIQAFFVCLLGSCIAGIVKIKNQNDTYQLKVQKCEICADILQLHSG